MTRFYLDTTIQLERHGGEPAVRSEIDTLLTGEAHSTSTHVWREWKRILEGAAIDILNALDEAEDFKALTARLRQGFGRTPAHRWLALDMIVGDLRNLPTIEAMTRFYLRNGFAALFNLDVDLMKDGSGCMLAREQARQQANGRWVLRTQCSRSECVCRQPEFLEHEKSRVAAAASALRASPDATHKRLGRTAQEVMAKPDHNHRKGSNCWGGGGLGGDVSIALECGTDETLLSTDQSFDHVCPAVGVQHRCICGTRTP